jgi:uncharacterized protein (TIGR02594 family)
MAGHNTAFLEIAGNYLGLEEWPGAKHNPTVVGFFETSGHDWVKDDETPWCAAFVGAVLAEAGVSGTGKLNARSYLDWGSHVSLKDAEPGDVVILSRGDPKGWQGHVAFLAGFEGGYMILRGGNQGNRVSDQRYPTSKLLGIRRYGGQPDQKTGRPVLREGDKGAFVLDAQSLMQRQKFFSGALDGAFGPLTKAAVMAFQDHAGLSTDGVVGPMTWRALMDAPVRSDRIVTESDLRDRRSRTIETADRGERVAKLGAVAVATGSVLDTAKEAAQKATDTLPAIQQALLDNWIVLLVGAVGVVSYFYGGKIMDSIRSIRVDDARDGANLKR